MATTKIRQTKKRRRDTPDPVRVAVLGALTIVVLALAAFMATRVYNGVPGVDYQTFYVNTPQVGNLLSHDQVKIDGVRVGQVTGRDVTDDGQPRIKLQLDPDVKLTEGTTAVFRANGLLGARFVDLKPGRGGDVLSDGGTLTGGPESYTSGVPEFLGTFDKETRGALGDTIGGLGQGLLGQGIRTNDSISIASTHALEFRDFARAVLERDGAAARLIPALDSAVRPLNNNREALSEANGVTAQAVTPFVTEREPTRAALSAAAPALASVRTGLTKGTELVAALDAFATEANRTLPNAPGGFAGLRDLLRDGRAPLAETQRLLRAARPAVPGLLRITDSLNPVLPKLRTTLKDSTHVLQEVGRYECDIRIFGTTMRSMTGFTQPGSGPAGPSQAFRLQIVLPLSVDVIGQADPSGFNVRKAVTPPCTYPYKPYPQAAGGTR